MFKHRRIFLVNRRFQLRFSFYVCSWLVALSLVYPLVIFNLFNYFIRYLALDPMGPAIAQLEATREDFIWLLIILQTILLSLTFLISIFMSHRIAGPLYKLRVYLEKVTRGETRDPISFRKSDYFQELAPVFNKMLDSINERSDTATSALNTAIPRLEATLSQAPLELRQELDSILRSLQTAQKN